MELRSALAQLDAANDEHWTSDGVPRVDAVSQILGSQVTRQQITDAAPTLTRNSVLEAADDQPVETPAAPAPWDHVSQEDAPAPTETPEAGSHVQEAPPAAPVEPTAEAPAAPEEPQQAIPVDHGFEPLVEAEILRRPFQEIASDPELLQEAIDAINELYNGMAAQKAELDRRMKLLAGKSEMASMVLSRIKKPQKSTHGIQDFLKRSAEAREERAANAKKFIQAGTTQGDVAAQLQTKSKIDAAMAQRKPTPGSQRPVHKPAHLR